MFKFWVILYNIITLYSYTQKLIFKINNVFIKEVPISRVPQIAYCPYILYNSFPFFQFKPD